MPVGQKRLFLEQADLDVYQLSPEQRFQEAETSAKALERYEAS